MVVVVDLEANRYRIIYQSCLEVFNVPGWVGSSPLNTIHFDPFFKSSQNSSFIILYGLLGNKIVLDPLVRPSPLAVEHLWSIVMPWLQL